MILITWILAFFIMLTVVTGMAVGVACGRKPISGSCGGLSAFDGDTTCEICGGNPTHCDAKTVKTLTAGRNLA
ncbi:MAG: (Na+)-NQR maturation NqrM [Gammaproteobacteria bacterium]|nr:(Na+)-NQR maturation NqrM [Gammaproteobacteria bacterium]MCZ6852360.1 (Na+)-NQR maturation NqrM [Gammaproteobacteria bacterium]